MHISNKCNEESRGEYEMFKLFNKQQVISEIYCEKAKKSCEVKFFKKSGENKIFYAKCLNGSGLIVRTGTYFVTKTLVYTDDHLSTTTKIDWKSLSGM